LRNLIERTVILDAFPEDFQRSVDDGDKGEQSLAEVDYAKGSLAALLKETWV
jgi:hypothetical protein